MAQRDYVSRGRSGPRRKRNSRKNSGSQVSKTMMILAVAVLMTFSGILYFLSQNKTEESIGITGTHSTQGNGLPPKPEERWSYIKELENKQVNVGRPVEPSGSNAINTQTQLTEEQRLLLEQMQADMRQQPTELPEVPSVARVETPRTQVITPPTDTSAAKSEQRVAPPEVRTPASTQPNDKKKSEEQNKQKAEKKVEAKSTERWMLQCGSFRSTDQAESIRAQLAFSGIESRITTEGGWKRVVLGPYDSRATVDKMLNRLRNAGTSGCIAVGIGG